MAVANLSDMYVALKAQSGLGSEATGTGASGIEVAASQGIAAQVATIESAMIQRSRMRKRPRHGTKSITAGYETELQVGNLDTVLEGGLGGTWVAAQAFDETDWGALTITGTGVTLTFAGGTIVTDGIRAGMMGRLTNMSEAGNNSKWFPILVAAEGVLTIPSGILEDNAEDAAWDIEIAKSIYTATPYTDRYFTVEEYLGTAVDRSKVATDMRINSLNFSSQPGSPIGLGFGMGGRALELKATGSSPHFTDPAFVDAASLVLVDGEVYVNGASVGGKVTGLTWGLAAPLTNLESIGSLTPVDVILGQFAFTGQATVWLEDGTYFDDFDAETRISLMLHCAEQGGVTEDFVSFYLGNLSYGGWSTPVGGEGGALQTIPLYGGEDERGTGYAPSTVVVSTTAA